MTSLDKIQQDWELLAQLDPHWAILSDPTKKGGQRDECEFFATGRVEIAQVLNDLATMAPELVRGSALDFGCGLGRLTQALSREFESAVGVDISSTMIEKAQELAQALPNCSYFLNSTPDLSALATGSLDFVYSRIVLQHIPRPIAREYIREFIRALRPGGVALFQVPSKPLSLRGRSRVAFGGAWQEATHLLRGGDRWEARCRLFGVPRRLVEHDLSESGGEVLAIDADASTGSDWESWMYCVRKPRTAN